MFLNESEFSGGLVGFLKTVLIMFLYTIPTFGIGLPWAICVWHRWSTRYTLIDGHEVLFDGSGATLLVHHLRWLLLTYCTCGLYLPFMLLNLKRWVAEHTHLAE